MTDPTPDPTPTRDEAVREIAMLIEEYDPKNSDWYFRRTVIREILDRLASAPAPASGRVDAVAWQTVSDFVDEMLRDWSGGDDCRMGFGLNGATVTKGQFRAVQVALASLSPAETPANIANCCHCGRIIDTREKSEGGDDWGHQLSDQRWVCSPECLDAVTDPAATPVSEAEPVAWPRLTEAMIRAACKAHYDSEEIDGIAMTSKERDWNFRQAFKRMWKGARSAAKPASSPAGGDVALLKWNSKQLEWRDGRSSETVFSVVQIAKILGAEDMVGLDYMILGPCRHGLYEVVLGAKIIATRGSEGEAKAAAQADYGDRLRATLSQSTSAGRVGE